MTPVGEREGPEPWSPDFRSLYRQHRVRMVRLAFVLTGGDPAAEELVQEAFLRVHRRLAQVDEPAAYLRRAVVNACISHGRRRTAERSALLRGLPLAGAAEDRPEELRDAVRRLPARQRAAVVLRYYEDLPEAEIAAALGASVAAVKSLLHRALQDLKKEIER